jgi:N,N'-diacetyllegionaminate synthase
MKVEIIAEIGSNWEGEIEKARKIIKECKKAGADAVKFQMWRAKDLYSSDHPEWKTIKKSELTFLKAKKIKKIADEEKIEFICSAFYPEAVSFLESLGVKRYKIASRTCLIKDPFAKETLIEKGQTKKPVIISMGMGGNKNKINNIFSKNKTLFCYCVSKYPLDVNEINWKKAIKFDGLSDHTLGITAPIVFTILKNKQHSKKILIEKHVKTKNSRGPDASTSITTEKLAEMIDHIKLIKNLKIN